MAAKYQLITELYRRTGVAVAKNPQAWQGFLSSACRNYKCRFDEQLLIYAQRPDAVAVAKLETWNRQFKRWVNKDSKGIAVFDPKGRRNTLKYYFDVSDTHEGYYGSRPVPIWQMDALPARVPASQRPLRLGQGACRHRGEQSLRPTGGRCRQRQGAFTGRYGLRTLKRGGQHVCPFVFFGSKLPGTSHF